MKRSAFLIIYFFLCLFPLGCQRKEGPAEKLGKEIDKSTESINSKLKGIISETEGKLGKATDDLKKSVDSFGKKIKKDTRTSVAEPNDSDKKALDEENN